MVKKKNPRKPKKAKSNSARGPFMVGHPLNGLPSNIRRQFVLESVARSKAKYAELLPKLLESVSRLAPLHSVALMSTYGLMGAAERQDKAVGKGWKPRIQQGHVEYLQALCLRHPIDLENSHFPAPPDIQNYFDWIPALFEASQLIRHPGVAAEGENEITSQNRMAIAGVQEFIRGHTSVVRNWGYFKNVTRISRALFERIDEPFSRVFGLKLTKVIDIFESLVRQQEDRINDHREKIHQAFARKPSQGAMVDAFFAAYPEFHGELAEFRARLTAPGVSMQEAFGRILAMTDRLVAQLLIIDCEKLGPEHNVDPKVLGTFFNWLSIGLGDLDEVDPEALFLDNPVWLRPLIYFSRNSYFCALPQTLMSFVFPIVDELIHPYPDLAKKLSLARASFLEDEVAALFEKGLPGAQLSRGFKWREGSQQFESDLVIRYDTTILLVEAKSGKVSWPALRGAPARMIDHIRTLIVEPSDQSGKLAQRLQEDIERVRGGRPTQLRFPLPMEGITCVVRLSVTLHDFATLQSVPGMLAEADVLKNTFPLAPCMSLADLETVLDLFDEPHVRLHYLRRRAELLFKINTIGDELDMLGFYLDTSLDVGAMSKERNTFLLTGYSKKVDRYYTLLDEGIRIPKPQPNISAWFTRLCEQLSKRKHPGWSEIACALLSVSPTDQRTIERRVRKISAKVKVGKMPKDDHDAILSIPPAGMKQALAFLVKRSDGVGYGADSQNIAKASFETPYVEKSIVIVVDAMSDELTYLSAGLFIANERNPNMTVFL
ncbi:hypothetical protein [Rhodoferax fermentans]|nr:hypothetical protein [Rhodoferax fermentans]